MSPGARRSDNEWTIEGLRGIAALLVVFAHYREWFPLPAWLAGFAFTGVDLFFVISGFVFAPYLHGRRLAWVPFLVRRFFRLYPLYALAVGLYVALRLWQGQMVDLVDHIAAHLLFVHTWMSREAAFFLNPAFWSLPPEVEFYLLLPLLALAVQRAHAVWVLAAVALALHLAVARALPADPAPVTAAVRLSVHLPGLLVEFMLGMLAWQAASRWRRHRARAGALAGGVTLWLALALAFATEAGRALMHGHVGLLAAAAFALIVAALPGGWPQPAHWLAAASDGLGRLSYGVYLFHNAAPPLLQPWREALPAPLFGALSLALTLAVAALLHATVEDPLRRFGRRWAAQRLSVAAAAGR